MSGIEFVLLVLGCVAIIVTLGRYAIVEGQRIEQHKKLIKNIKEHDKKLKNDSRN